MRLFKILLKGKIMEDVEDDENDLVSETVITELMDEEE